MEFSSCNYCEFLSYFVFCFFFCFFGAILFICYANILFWLNVIHYKFLSAKKKKKRNQYEKHNRVFHIAVKWVNELMNNLLTCQTWMTFLIDRVSDIEFRVKKIILELKCCHWRNIFILYWFFTWRCYYVSCFLRYSRRCKTKTKEEGL